MELACQEPPGENEIGEARMWLISRQRTELDLEVCEARPGQEEAIGGLGLELHWALGRMH